MFLENWAQISLIVLVMGATVATFIYDYNRKPPEKMFFGQQFHESDLKNTTGKMNKLAIACDLTTTIVPDLLSDGFIPTETSTIADVDNNVYVMTFWNRADNMRIVTETDKNNLTCIISVSNNVKPLQSSPQPGQIDGETRDNLDGIVPL